MAVLGRGLALAACVALLLGGWAQPAFAQQTIEAEVKAAFLYNFTKYVDWPPAAFQDEAEPFRMCVVGPPAFVASVEALVKGETARARPIHVVPSPTSQFNRCHILFVSAQDAQRMASAVHAVSSRPVLTVVESLTLFEQGSAVLLAVDGSRVRFDINLAAVHRAGLNVSSKLLRVARNIKPEVPVR